MSNRAGYALPAGVDVDLGHTIIRDPHTDHEAMLTVASWLPAAEAREVLEALGLIGPRAKED